MIVTRRALSGILILIMILLTIVSGIYRVEMSTSLLWFGGIAGWCAAVLLFPDTSTILRIQIGIIVASGITLGLYAVSLGGAINFDAIITGNTQLLTMVAAVGFLRLVALPETDSRETLPTGPKAYLQTLLGLSLTSAVINISSPILLADRIHNVRPLQRFTAQSMTRVFCGAACWSPFFAAMAVVLTYTENASLAWLILAGLPITLSGLIVVLIEARLRHKQDMQDFIGYPIHLQSITIPLLLACAVISGSWLMPDTPILVVISMSALFITAAVLLKRVGFHLGGRQLKFYTTEGLPRIVNELTLFLAAGVIAAGMSALIQEDIVTSPFNRFDAINAAQLLGMMLLLSATGIHPVIQISSVSPLLLPLAPDPNLLAITFLMAWSLGTCASPLSGTNLVFQGRYDIASWKIATWNWPYALLMYGIAALWLQLLASF